MRKDERGGREKGGEGPERTRAIKYGEFMTISAVAFPKFVNSFSIVIIYHYLVMLLF